MKKMILSVLALVLATVPATVSAATIITYKGTVFDRQGSGNQDQYFGSVIAGTTAYQLVYSIADGAVGTLSSPDAYTLRFGGAASVTAVMTINGISQLIRGTHESYVYASNNKPNSLNNPTDAIGQKSQDFVDDGAVYRDVYAESMLSEVVPPSWTVWRLS